MTDLRTLLDDIADAAPTLRQWRAEFGTGDDTHVMWLELAYALASNARDGVIPELPAIAPMLETALARFDERHEVTLGFLETLLGIAEEQGLNTHALQRDQGPSAAREWESLSDYRHQSDDVLIGFRAADIGKFASAAAHLERWLITPPVRLAAESPIARLRVGGASYALRTTVPCLISRLVAENGQELHDGDQLAYLRPTDYRELHRREPYVKVDPVAQD